MRTIAIEEHFFSSSARLSAERYAASQGRGLPPNLTGERLAKISDLGALRLRDMDAGGIDLQVISQVDGLVALDPRDDSVSLAREANDQLAAAIAAHPDRFAGFATLPMNSPRAAADELERAVCSLGFRGPMIHGMTNGRFLDDAAFFPILERAASLKVPIYLHPAQPPAPVREAYYTGVPPAISFALATSSWGWHSEVGLHALRLVLAGIFDRLPNLQIIIGHMGEMIPFMMARSDERLTPLAKHLQRPVQEYLRSHFYITTSGFFTDPPLLLALQTMGADRIIFSVDYPFSANEQGREFLDAMSVSPLDKEKISHLNAERLLRLDIAGKE